MITEEQIKQTNRWIFYDHAEQPLYIVKDHALILNTLKHNNKLQKGNKKLLNPRNCRKPLHIHNLYNN